MKTRLIPACLLIVAGASSFSLTAAAEPVDKPVAVKSTSAQATAGSSKPGVVSAVVEGREVSVTAPDAISTINVTGPKAEVRVGPQLLIIERNQITLDGKFLGEIPGTAQKVEITLVKGTLSIKADGKEVTQEKVDQTPR